MENSKELVLAQSNQILDLFMNLKQSDQSPIIREIETGGYPAGGKLLVNEMCFFRIKQLSYEEDYPRREAFENVLLSMDNQAFNFVYVLTGSVDGIDLCVGVVKNHKENETLLGKKLSTADYGKIVSNALEGNFNGSTLEPLRGSSLTNWVEDITKKYKNAGVIVGIPSANKKDSGDEYDFQGIDRLINSMLGLEWRLVVVCEPVARGEVLETMDAAYELYNRLSVFSKMTCQYSENDSSSISFGQNQSESKGKNASYTKGTSHSSGKQTETTNSSSGRNESNSQGTSRDVSKGTNQGISQNRGSSKSVTFEMANKCAEDIMKYIDEDLMPRLKSGYNKGLFKTSVYYMAKEPAHANRLKVGILSLFQGDNSIYSPLNAHLFGLEESETSKILSTFQNRSVPMGNYLEDALLLLGRPYADNFVSLSTYLTSDEVALIAGLPQKEVPGLALKESVGFGLNETIRCKESAIDLGVTVQKGRSLDKIHFYLDKKSMAKHTFVAGVTGSGKTTTCHRLLSEANMPFLVIEPAKTEYRTLLNANDDLVVFTLGNESVAPFRINPFELIEGEIISAHIDMVKATFTSAFPMEASMPQLLEEAIYRCYEKKGWNISTNENDIYEERAFDPDVNSFPILSDLLEEMTKVVEEKRFGAELQANYIGSLVSRLSNLTVGSKGNILNCPHSTDFRYIARNNVILEMEELKSPEDKALFMGFVLSRLSAVIKDEHKKDPEFKHLTLVEEAHRLLSKVDYGDSGSKKSAVETFSDLLAEVRKYGEGLVIVDQIPNKLAPEVLKNTNTKIIHKILAKDDKEAVGDTMLMDSKQKEYLSSLSVGHAIVFSEQTDKPVHVRITPVSNTGEGQIDDRLVKKRFHEKKHALGSCYKDLEIIGVYPLFDAVAKEIAHARMKKEDVNRLYKKILAVQRNYSLEPSTVLEMLVQRRDNISGKAAASALDQNTRTAYITEFFLTTVFKEDFCEDRILENRNIIIYLR